MKKICEDYCGISCVNGNCPKALYNDEYLLYVDIYGTTKKPNCNNCGYYKGCEDCYFSGNDKYPCELIEERNINKKKIKKMKKEYL